MIFFTNFSAKKIGGNLQDLLVYGSDFSANARGLYFTDNKGLEVTNLTIDFSITDNAMLFKNTTLQTRTSHIKANIDFKYGKNDLASFNDKVQIKAKFEKSTLSIQDLKKYLNHFLSHSFVFDSFMV